MDELDRLILNGLQGGFPLCERPFAAAAERLGTSEAQLIERIRGLLERGVLTRFGPLFNADRMGGMNTLCAVHVPPAELEAAVSRINRYPEVAHHYERDHHLNLWFVLAVEEPEEIPRVLADLETGLGRPVLNMPKTEEYFVGLRLEV